jgi:plasmid maintenance system antidote protein VapI
MVSDNYDFQPFLIPVKPLTPALCEILPQIGAIESGILGTYSGEVVHPSERSLAEFAKLLGISRSHLYAIEQGHRAVSPERAARFAQALDPSEAQFVMLALQDRIRSAGLRLTIEVKAA